MKKIQLMLLFVFSFIMGSFAQGIVKEKQIIKSTILNKDVHYTIYLPSDYYTSERAYPVTYLLHGYGDADDGWIQFGEVNRLANDAIKEGTIPPMIIVTPDGFTSFYINAANGNLSAAVWTDNDIINLNEKMFNGLFGNSMGKNLKGKDRLTAAWLSNSPIAIIEKKTKEELSSVKYWIDCGDDDFLTIGNAQLHIALTNKNVPHEFRMRDGAHNWTYWRTGIINALSFIGDSFHQK